MYKNCQKLYMSVSICIQIIHINADIEKNRPKLYMSGWICIQIIYISMPICIKIAKNYTCPVAETRNNNASIQSKSSMERYS